MCADIPTAKLGANVRHAHVLVHHPDAGLGGILRDRQDRRVAGVAHHGDSVRRGSDGLTQLLDHFLRTPAGKNIVDLGASIGRRLFGAVGDVIVPKAALRTADEEADVYILAPLVATGGVAAATVASTATAAAVERRAIRADSPRLMPFPPCGLPHLRRAFRSPDGAGSFLSDPRTMAAVGEVGFRKRLR